jgi:hypothetical protein
MMEYCISVLARPTSRNEFVSVQVLQVPVCIARLEWQLYFMP